MYTERFFLPFTGSSNNILAKKFNEWIRVLPDEFCDKMDELILDSSTWFSYNPKGYFTWCACCARTDQCDLWAIHLQYIACGGGGGGGGVGNVYNFNIGNAFSFQINNG